MNLENYLEKIYQLANYPESKRLFSELHEESLKILEEKGQTQLLFIPKQVFNYENHEREIRLHLTYEKHFWHDKLDIMLYNTGNSQEFVMRRLRGYKIKEELESEDFVSRNSKGKSLKYIFSKLLEYQPCALGIKENESQKIIKF